MPLYLSIPLMLALLAAAVTVDAVLGITGTPVVLLGASALWAYHDSGRIGLTRYHHPFGHRTGLVFAMLLLWIAVFPLYFHVRRQILRGTRPLIAG